ncbi:MAG TPA: hypothetical protein VNI02_01880 [Blastocatellia bacterium]|nr:hypothetical protein [Blastocatellia bacterium]
MRFLCAILICSFGVGFISCGNKPAYSNINTSREVREANQNGGQPATGPTGAVADQTNTSTQPTEAQSQQPTPPPQQFKPPKFMANGEAKDLPNYPQAVMKSIQFGPIQGTDTLSLVLETRDPMDKIAAFYDKVIKSNGWTVDSKTFDPEFAEWNLRKPFDNEGKVQVKRDPRTNAMNIVIARTEKITE